MAVVEMVVGLLGRLKAGGAFVPIDPAYPPERVRLYLDDSGANLHAFNASTAVMPAAMSSLC